jgi:hypothetical protein
VKTNNTLGGQPSTSVRELAEAIAVRHREFVREQTELFPEIPFGLARTPTPADWIRAWLGVVYICLASIGRRRYVFEVGRNEMLLECLDPEEVVVLGGRQLLAMCRQRGYRLFWTGGIISAVILAANSGTFVPLCWQLRLMRWRMGKQRRSVFVPSDALPTGNFFVALANASGHTSVCLQHGIFTPGVAKIVEGQLCRVNVLYDRSQEAIIGHPDSLYLELGPPVDATVHGALTRTAVLVGTGLNFGDMNMYRETLQRLQRIAARLEETGWAVSYRPHPAEDVVECARYFSKLDMTAKSMCLSTPRKVFVGYCSTLLWEAHAFGHRVVSLKHRDVPGPFIPADLTLPEADSDSVPAILAASHGDWRADTRPTLPPVRERFKAVLRQIDQLADSRAPLVTEVR